MSDFLVLCVFIFLCCWLFANFEENRHARIERILNRTFDLVEQGHFSQEEGDKIKEMLKNAK